MKQKLFLWLKSIGFVVIPLFFWWLYEKFGIVWAVAANVFPFIAAPIYFFLKSSEKRKWCYWGISAVTTVVGSVGMYHWIEAQFSHGLHDEPFNWFRPDQNLTIVISTLSLVLLMDAVYMVFQRFVKNSNPIERFRHIAIKPIVFYMKSIGSVLLLYALMILFCHANGFWLAFGGVLSSGWYLLKKNTVNPWRYLLVSSLTALAMIGIFCHYHLWNWQFFTSDMLNGAFVFMLVFPPMLFLDAIFMLIDRYHTKKTSEVSADSFEPTEPENTEILTEEG